jgi:glycosyltransferase involved in cell wall biosynthesis
LKILHLIKTSEGATWAVRLLKEIHKRYEDVSFSVVIPKGGKHFYEYTRFCKNVYEFSYSIDENLFSSGKKFKQIIQNDNPDIIHSWFTQTTLYARLFLRDIKIPRIFQVVGPAHLENTLFRLGDLKSAQNSDYWIATSKYIYNKYKNAGISESKLFLNYAFIDIENILESKDQIQPRNFRKEFNLKTNTKIIGTASYIYPPKFYEKGGIKGHEYLLEAYRLLLEERDDIVLVIAGKTFGNDRSYENKLKELAQKISPSKIFFTGGFNHIYEVIHNFDVFVYLSKSENLGGVYESLLFEIPTISSNRGALPELVINNETGFNVDPTNYKELVKKIDLLLDNDLPMYRKRGKELVLETFNKNYIIDKTYKLYKNIINKEINL